ncbi:MAG: hypothetical protein CBB87_10640 [Micavibrio sp. TMED27]|nr:hypothetical protein [Micavibrio sp.]OUT90209.1 MAG: hypothetical protein CBB87_10640 [Micavibrio sp. TMED27]
MTLIAIVVFQPTIANAAPQKRIEFLLYFFDINESAFAYHRHCLSQTEELNTTFLQTLEFVADELFDEAKKNEPKTKPEYIKTKILERRYNIQYRLDHANMKDGCYSQASLKAKEHYQEFSNYNTSQIRKFIDERTGG